LDPLLQLREIRHRILQSRSRDTRGLPDETSRQHGLTMINAARRGGFPPGFFDEGATRSLPQR
ncbi:MAG: hypothetical protein AB7V53_12240, partial [Dongiaceae bacterium]